ncbi:isocitrate lyase/PEP mutase family protein [Streptosporangium sp. KLBMP 9127]|nr:isocitrate lyase/phosphoenolpyruvate mutase family protein [Streptosporangium sp. KLBMP 9127]
MITQNDKALRFRSLHEGGRPLILANAWDVVSARLVEEAGASAIATTSAGVAWSLGVPDGDLLGRDRVFDLVSRMAAAVALPVTADIESGYSATPGGVGETIRGVMQAGAVGVNIEDALYGSASALRAVPEQAERIAAAREAAGRPELFVNARIDTYLRQVGDPAARLDDTLARAAAYLEAGADGIFVPGVTDPDTVATLTVGIPAPLNVLAGPTAPDIATLAGLGVARVSLGSSIAAAAYALVQRAAEEAFTQGTYLSLAGGLTYGELNSLFA